LPDVPTFAEAGYPGFNMAINFGLVAPARTPLAVVDKIAADVREVMRNPDLETKTLVPLGLNVVDDSPAKFAAFLREERKAAAEGAKRAEIRPE
jgi:tripartite-type tricarboxylate transporter receptor subunit TctC